MAIDDIENETLRGAIRKHFPTVDLSPEDATAINNALLAVDATRVSLEETLGKNGIDVNALDATSPEDPRLASPKDSFKMALDASLTETAPGVFDSVIKTLKDNNYTDLTPFYSFLSTNRGFQHIRKLETANSHFLDEKAPGLREAVFRRPMRKASKDELVSRFYFLFTDIQELVFTRCDRKLQDSYEAITQILGGDDQDKIRKAEENLRVFFPEEQYPNLRELTDFDLLNMEKMTAQAENLEEEQKRRNAQKALTVEGKLLGARGLLEKQALLLASQLKEALDGYIFDNLGMQLITVMQGLQKIIEIDEGILKETTLPLIDFYNCFWELLKRNDLKLPEDGVFEGTVKGLKGFTEGEDPIAWFKKQVKETEKRLRPSLLTRIRTRLFNRPKQPFSFGTIVGRLPGKRRRKKRETGKSESVESKNLFQGPKSLDAGESPSFETVSLLGVERGQVFESEEKLRETVESVLKETYPTLKSDGKEVLFKEEYDLKKDAEGNIVLGIKTKEAVSRDIDYHMKENEYVVSEVTKGDDDGFYRAAVFAREMMGHTALDICKVPDELQDQAEEQIARAGLKVIGMKQKPTMTIKAIR